MDGGGQVKVMEEVILEPILPEEPIVGPKTQGHGPSAQDVKPFITIIYELQNTKVTSHPNETINQTNKSSAARMIRH